jgi:large conductance mechanosensitive channel
MTMMEEFKAFINKGNVIDLAVAVVVGGAFNDIVKAIVSGLIMPIANMFLPNGDWEKWHIGKIKTGAILDATLHFLIISFVVFIMLKKFLKVKQAEAAAPTTPPSEDILLLREIRDALRQPR